MKLVLRGSVGLAEAEREGVVAEAGDETSGPGRAHGQLLIEPGKRRRPGLRGRG